MSQAAVLNEVSSPRIQRRRERTRETILRAATECFNAKSVATVSVEEIIEAADVSRGTFYRLFRHKEDVFLEIARPMLDLYAAALGEIDATDPRDLFDGIVDVYIRVWRELPDAFSLASKESRNVFHLVEDLHRPAMERMRGLFEQIEPHGILRAGKAEYAVALFARSAVVVLRTLKDDPDWERLFRVSMTGFLLKKLDD